MKQTLNLQKKRKNNWNLEIQRKKERKREKIVEILRFKERKKEKGKILAHITLLQKQKRAKNMADPKVKKKSKASKTRLPNKKTCLIESVFKKYFLVIF